MISIPYKVPRRLFPAVALVVLAFPTMAIAQPNSVRVQLRIQNQSYRDELGSVLSRAEEILQKLAVIELQSRVGFLRFTTEPNPNRVVIDIGNTDRQPGEPINFHLRAIPGDGKDLTWSFRSGAEIISALSKKASLEDKIKDVELVGVGDTQPGEFRRKFSRVGLDPLVKALRFMPVASKGNMTEGPPDPLWDLPVSRAETCMDLSSQFTIDHRLSGSSGQAEKVRLAVEAIGPDGSSSDAMRGHIQARVPASPDQKVLIQRLGNPNVQKVEVEAVYMLDYHPGDCNAVTLPTESGLGKGGPQ
jgi:hypothetical protein